MEELRAYLKEVGAEISTERSPKGLEDDLHKIIGVSDTAFASQSTEAEVEALLNSIVSVLIVVSGTIIIECSCDMKLCNISLKALAKGSRLLAMFLSRCLQLVNMIFIHYNSLFVYLMKRIGK